jgi:hypothetical protein
LLTVAHTCGYRRGRAATCPACRSDDLGRLLSLSGERDRYWRGWEYAWRMGYAAAGDPEGFTYRELADAYTAGQRDAHADDLDAFDAGWAACLDRFAGLIGGRVYPAHPAPIELKRWTRHHPDCRIGRNGRRPCRRLGCLPGPREDFGKPAPWDDPHLPKADAS